MSAGVEKAIQEDGYVVIPDLLSPDFVRRARAELTRAIEADSDRYGPQAARDYGMVMLCALHGGAFLELFDNNRLLEPINAVLGSECIVYAYTSSSMPPHGRNFAARIHRDCPRSIPGYVTNMGVTLPLDDFREDNGAMWFVPRSHTWTHEPSPDEFYSAARRLLVPAGSAFVFDARLWHAGGENTTGEWRHALTINMCRPYMKQRIDIPRAMAGVDLSGASEQVLQKLGFRAQPPASLEEYYLPPEKRSFRQPTR